MSYFFVIEGPDGVGKSRVSKMVVERLLGSGTGAYWTSEPSKGPVGKLIRQILSGALEVTSSFEGYPRDGSLVSLGALFAADRRDHVAYEIEPRLKQGIIVVSDRYYHSSYAYQALNSSIDHLTELNRQARVPDLTLILQATPAVRWARLISGGKSKEIFDDESIQLRLGATYAQLPKLLPDQRIEFIDASQDVEEVVSAVFDVICKFISDSSKTLAACS